MAFVPQFKHDLFISYSHADNAAPHGKKGWVSEFKEKLESSFINRFGYNIIAIWYDKELTGNTIFDDRIKNILEESALFLALGSKNSFDSEYCRKERQWFCRTAENSSFGLRLGDISRVIPIFLRNIPFNEWPQEFNGLSGFRMHDAAEKSLELGDKLLIDSLDFDIALRKIVDAVEKSLNLLNNEVSVGKDNPAEKHSVFFADTDLSSQKTRTQLMRDVDSEGFRVVDSIPIEEKVYNHDSSAAETIEKTILSVHIFGAFPGELIDDVTGKTFPMRQLEIALQSKAPQLIWIPDSLDVAKLQNQTYLNFLKNLIESTDQERKYDLVRKSKTDFQNILIDKIRRLREQKSSNNGQTPLLLLNSHIKDRPFSNKFASCLDDKGVDYEYDIDSHDQSDSLSKFEKWCNCTRDLVLIFGNVEQKWVEQRLRIAVQIAVQNYEKSKDKKFWIVASPPKKEQSQLKDIFPYLSIRWIDNSDAQSICADKLEPLLESYRQGGHC